MELRVSFLAVTVILLLCEHLLVNGLPAEARQDNNPGTGISGSQFSFGQGPRPANTKGFASNLHPEHTIPTKTTDSYGQPVQYLNAPHGKPIEIGVKTDVNKDTGTQLQGDYKILSTSGLQFAIPSYASGITELKEPLDGILPPIESGEDATNLKPIIIPIISPTVDVPPPISEPEFPPLSNPNTVNDISQNEIVGAPKDNNITQPPGTQGKNNPSNGSNQPEEDKTPETFGVKYTGGFGGPPGFLGEQKDIGYAIKEKNEKEKAEADAGAIPTTNGPLNTVPAQADKTGPSHEDPSKKPISESGSNQRTIDKTSFPPFPTPFGQPGANPPSGSKPPSIDRSSFPPFPGSTHDDPLKKPVSGLNQPSTDRPAFPPFPTPFDQSSPNSPSVSKQSSTDQTDFIPFPSTFHATMPTFERGPVPTSQPILNPLSSSTHSPSSIPELSDRNQPSLPKFEPGPAFPNSQAGLNPSTLPTHSPGFIPNQPKVNQPSLPNFQTGLNPSNTPTYSSAPIPQVEKAPNPYQSNPFPIFDPYPVPPEVQSNFPKYDENPIHSDISQQQSPSFGQGPSQVDEYTKPVDMGTNRITVSSNLPSFPHNLNDQRPNSFIPTFAPIPIKSEPNPSKPNNFPIPFQSTPGTLTHPNQQFPQNTNNQPNFNPISQQPNLTPISQQPNLNPFSQQPLSGTKFTPPNNVHNSQPTFSVTTKPKVPSGDAPGKYTGGFGGAPGVLGEQIQPGFAVKPDGTIKDPDHTYRPPAQVQVTTPKPHPTTIKPVLPPHTGGPAPHQPGSDAGKYMGGFGGPPGVLSPFDKH